MGNEEQFCNNCKRNVAAANYVVHALHCERKIQLCQLCGEPVPRTNLDVHLKENHVLECCSFCKMPFEKWKLDSHQKDECHKRQVICKYCDLSQMFDSISEHEENCGSRTDECMFCNGRYLLKEKETHLRICQKYQVLKTQMLCNYCETEFPADIYSEHMMRCVFRSEKCLMCGELVKLKDLEKHSDMHSKESQRQATYICDDCDQKLSPKELQTHQSVCKANFRTCRQCLKSVKISDLESHQEMCQRDNRRLRQSSYFCEHCGQKFSREGLQNHESSCKAQRKTCHQCLKDVKISDFDQHLEICQQEKVRPASYFCGYCKRNFSFEEFQDHESVCKALFKTCRQCHESVHVSDIDHHVEICQKEKVRLASYFCEYCKKKLSLEEFQDHESVCQALFKTCRQCHESVQVSDIDHHVEICQKVKKSDLVSRCEHCERKYPSEMLAIHEASCEHRFEKCALCYELVQYKSMQSHKEVCGQIKKCQSKIACEHCGSKFPLDMLKDHKSNCDLYCENCPLCDAAVKVKDMENHRSICEQKRKVHSKVTCEHCGDQYPFKIIDDHEKNCGLQLEKCCMCYDFVRVKDMDSHRKTCEQNKSMQLPIFCDFCELEFPSEEYSYHKISCGAQIKKCSLCERVFKIRDFAEHEITCLKNKFGEDEEDFSKYYLNEQTPDERFVCYDCQKVSRKLTSGYATFYCSCIYHLDSGRATMVCLSTVLCKDVNGKDKEDKNYHVDLAQRVESDEHPVSCDYCNERFPLNCIELHMETCGDCVESCNSCNALVKFKDRSTHRKNCMKPCDRLTKCSFCGVSFRSDFLPEHFEICGERIENCLNCKLPVMLRDKRKHINSCEQVSGEEKCAICFLSLPKDELSDHFKMCVVANSDSLYSDCGKSLTFPTASGSDDNKIILQPENSKTNAYPSMGNVKLCPYCSINFPLKRFDNHKRYCTKALKTCPICDDTYHIEESDEHKKTCDVLDTVLSPEDDFSMELKNKFESLPSEESMKEKEALSEVCPFCNCKIPTVSYTEHLSTCAISVKVCHFCKTEYPKDSKKDHLLVCPKFSSDRDEFLYQGFSKSPHKTEDYPGNTIKCFKCHKYIPQGAMDSHLTSCSAVKKCEYCKNVIGGNMQKHFTRCDIYKKMQQNALMDGSNGAKPKKTKSREYEGTFHKIMGSVKSFLSGSEKPSHNPSQADQYLTTYKEEKFTAISAPPEEILYVSCEFCNEKILMDPEAIVMHESGCRPDLISHPTAVSERVSSKSVHDEYFYENQASAPLKRSSYIQHEIKTPDEDSSRVEPRNIENYSFMEHFNRYDTVKDFSYQKDLEEKASRGNLKSEINDDKRYPNKYEIVSEKTWDHKDESRFKHMEEKSENNGVKGNRDKHRIDEENKWVEEEDSNSKYLGGKTEINNIKNYDDNYEVRDQNVCKPREVSAFKYRKEKSKNDASLHYFDQFTNDAENRWDSTRDSRFRDPDYKSDIDNNKHHPVKYEIENKYDRGYKKDLGFNYTKKYSSKQTKGEKRESIEKNADIYQRESHLHKSKIFNEPGEKHENKDTNIGYPENDGIEENADVYQVTSLLHRSKISTEPGEFLKNNFDSEQLSLISSKKTERFSPDSNFDNNTNLQLQKNVKLYQAWQEIDAKNTETVHKNIHHHSDNLIHDYNRKKQSSEESKKSEWMINKSSPDNSKGAIEMKTHSSKVMGASTFIDKPHSDPESTVEFKSEYGHKSSIYSERKFLTKPSNQYQPDQHKKNECFSSTYSTKDYKKDINAFHKLHHSTELFEKNTCSDNPQCDSDPESCKSMKDPNAYRNEIDINKTRHTEPRKVSNQDLFNAKDSSIVCSSEIEGPLKIDHVRKRDGKTSQYLDKYERNKQLAESSVKETFYPEKSKHNNSYGKSSEERSYDKHANKVQPTANLYPDVLKYTSYKQYSEASAKNEEPMEIDDDVVKKHPYVNTDSTFCSKKYQEAPDSETKDSNMDSYFRYLENDRDEQSETSACRKCGNLLCVCKINKSLSTVKNHGSCDAFDNKDSYPYKAGPGQETDPKSYEKEKSYRNSKAKSLFDDKKAHDQANDRWIKYREPSDESE